MIQFWIAVVGMLVLGVIFLRRFMILEHGVTLKSLLFRKKNIFRHVEHPETLNLTVEEMLPAAETVNPKDRAKADSLVRKAEIGLKRGALKESEQLLIKALALDPSSVEAHNKLGLIYLQQGMFGKAESIYRKLTLTLSHEPAYFGNLGMALYSQGKLDDAKVFYKKALEIDATRPGRFFSLGRIFTELNEVEEAIAHLKKAVEMDPRNLDYLLTLAQLYVDKNLPVEAKQLLGEILLISPDNEMALLLMDKTREEDGPKVTLDEKAE
ncbi:tetratricopeptide repeat protein [Candidatus Peregrinibacteria bacterium]|nr:tetratricopeptide repeat protein [Candidatus Peregrinibacteria bacterium]